MATNTKIATDITRPDIGEVISLYQLDTTDLGGDIYYFTKSTNDGSSVVYNGITYLPIDFEFKDNEYNQDGLPRPKFRISNVSITLQAEIIAYNNLLGAELTRIRTLKKYLDGESDADPSARFPIDTYILHKKMAHNKLYIEWEVRSPLDNYRTLIPKRQILREICQFQYRTYSTETSDFVYSDANPCPYTGTDYFTRDGSSTTIANDVCGKRLSDCQLRFPSGGVPFQGFPSVAKIRI